MTDQQIISGQDRPIEVLEKLGTGAALREWLLAHGINPYDVPADAAIRVETHAHSGHQRITYEVYLKDHEGLRFAVAAGGPAAREPRSCALLFPVPPCLVREPEPAADDTAADADGEQPVEQAGADGATQ